jgi:uncharacterized membrane protein YozB (DUF420 family)
LGFISSISPLAADLNLLAQIIVLGLLLAGAILAKNSEFKIHGRIMIAAIVFQFVAVSSWMLPSLILNFGALGSGGVGTVITLMHFLLGTFTLALTVAAAFHLKLERELKWTMRLAFSAWVLVAILGILFYAHYYLGIL